MKKISLVLALVLSVLVTTAQTWTKVNGRWEYQYMRFDNTVGTFTPPQDTIPGAPVGSLAVKNDIPYYKTSSSGWIPVTGAAANLATTNLVATGNYSHNWNNKQLIIDSVTQYYLFTRAKRFGLWERGGISFVPGSDAGLISMATRKADNSADSISSGVQWVASDFLSIFTGNASGRNANINVRAGGPAGKSSIVAQADTVRIQSIPQNTADTVLATGPYDPVTKTNPLYRIKLNTTGQNIANTGLFANGDYDQNWRNYQLRIDSMKSTTLIARGNFLGNQSRSILAFNPSFAFPMILSSAQRDAADLIDSMNSTFQFISDGGTWSAANANNGSAAIQLRTGLTTSSKPYISLSADSILAKLKPVSAGDSVLVTGIYNPGTGFNPIYKAPLSGLVGAQNGLNRNGINIELGGALTKKDTITTTDPSHGLVIIGANNGSGGAIPTLQVSADTSGTAVKVTSKNGPAIAAISFGPNNPTAIFGQSLQYDGFTYGAGTGVQGSTGTGTGLFGFAQSTGIGTYTVSGSGLALYGQSSLSAFTLESNNATYPSSGVHTIGSFNKLNQGQFFGAPGAGFGSSIDYGLTADNSTSTGVSRVGLKFITKWATATDASRSAAWELQLVNNATLARKLRMEPDGTLTLDRYASSVSGTAAFGLGVDNTGKLVTTTASGVSASNGLTAVGTDIQLGGTITGVTTITSTGSSSNRIVVNGTSSTAWAPFYVNDNGTGGALMGLQSNAGGRAIIAQNFASGGVSMSTTSNAGVALNAFDGGNGTGVAASSSQGLPLSVISDLNNGNATNTALQIIRNNGTAATGASAGLGADVLVKLEDGSSSGTTLDAGKISTYWNDVTSGQEKSAIDFWTRNNGYFSSKFSIKDTGQLQATRYGTGNFATIDTSYPAAVFGPDGKIYARRGDAGGGGGSTPTWQQTLTAGSTLTTDNNVNLSSTDFQMGGTNDIGYYYTKFDKANGVWRTVNKSSAGASDSMSVELDNNAGEVFIQNTNPGNANRSIMDMQGNGALLNSSNLAGSRKAEVKLDTLVAAITSGTVSAAHQIQVFKDSIELRNTYAAQTKLYIPYLPQSSSSSDSVLVRDAAGKVLTRAQSAIVPATVKFVQTATVSVIANDVETTLTGSGTGSLTIPAGTMTAGKAYRLTVRGTYGTDASNPAQQNWRVYLGGTLVLASGNAGLGTNKTDKIFVTQVDITCRTTGSSGSVMAVGMFNTEDGPGAKGFAPTTTTVNTTTNLTLDFTTDLTDGSAGNNIKVYSLIFEEI